MAPEQAAGESQRVGLPADVWTLGVLLFHLATSQWPFEMGGPQSEALARVITQDPAHPRTLDRRVPVDLEAVILRCLARDPRARYPTAGALAEDLKRYLASEPVQARRATLAYVLGKSLRRHRTATALVFGGLVTAIGATAWHQHTQAETNRRLKSALDEAINLRSFLLFDLRWDFDRSGREAATAAAARAQSFTGRRTDTPFPPGPRFDPRRFEALAANLRGQAAAFRENLAAALTEFEREHDLNLQLVSVHPQDESVTSDAVAARRSPPCSFDWSALGK